MGERDAAHLAQRQGPAEDGSQLVVLLIEIPHQSLWVRALIMRPDGDDTELVDEWLQNTTYYEGGLRTELHRVLDGGALALDIWVEPDSIDRPYKRRRTCALVD